MNWGYDFDLASTECIDVSAPADVSALRNAELINSSTGWLHSSPSLSVNSESSAGSHDSGYDSAWAPSYPAPTPGISSCPPENPTSSPPAPLYPCPETGCDRVGKKGYVRKLNLEKHLINKHGTPETRSAKTLRFERPMRLKTALQRSDRYGAPPPKQSSGISELYTRSAINSLIHDREQEPESVKDNRNELPIPRAVSLAPTDSANLEANGPQPNSEEAIGSPTGQLGAPEPRIFRSIPMDMLLSDEIEPKPGDAEDPSVDSSRAPSPWQHITSGFQNEQRRVNDHLSRSLDWLLHSVRTDDEDSEPSSGIEPASLPKATPTAEAVSTDEALNSPNLSDHTIQSLSSPIEDWAVKRRQLAELSRSVRELVMQVPKRRFSFKAESNPPTSDISLSDDTENGSAAQSSTSDSPSRGNESTRQSSTKPSNTRKRDASDDDGHVGNDPPPPSKQQKTGLQDPLWSLKCVRYACPYNKWDPFGCPFCCSPSNKNREGGAASFSRVKTHIFRNHDLSIRCHQCWAAYPKAEELKEHSQKNECMLKASPTKYWMTEEQRRLVRGQRFNGTGDENWYHLFRILLPDVILQDNQGSYLFTPDYVPHNACLASTTGSSISFSQSQGISHPPLITSGPTPTLNPGESINLTYSNEAPLPTQTFEPTAPNENPWGPISDLMLDLNSPIGIERLGTATTSNHPTLDFTNPLPSHAIDPSRAPINPMEFGATSLETPSPSDESTPPAPAASSHQASTAFLVMDVERLRQSNQQLRSERDALRRRVEASTGRLDPLNQILEQALYHQEAPPDVCKKLFELSKAIEDLKKELL